MNKFGLWLARKLMPLSYWTGYQCGVEDMEQKAQERLKMILNQTTRAQVRGALEGDALILIMRAEQKVEEHS